MTLWFCPKIPWLNDVFLALLFIFPVPPVYPCYPSPLQHSDCLFTANAVVFLFMSKAFLVILFVVDWFSLLDLISIACFFIVIVLWLSFACLECTLLHPKKVRQIVYVCILCMLCVRRYTSEMLIVRYISIIMIAWLALCYCFCDFVAHSFVLKQRQSASILLRCYYVVCWISDSIAWLIGCWLNGDGIEVNRSVFLDCRCSAHYCMFADVFCCMSCACVAWRSVVRMLRRNLATRSRNKVILRVQRVSTSTIPPGIRYYIVLNVYFVVWFFDLCCCFP